VKPKIRRRLARAKHKIESRLAAAVMINETGPVTRGRPHYELSDKARGNSWGGIGALHRLALKLKLPERINNALHLLKLHVLQGTFTPTPGM
jgi:hypothetical protein